MELKEFIKLCKQARQDKNITLEQVAKEIGCKVANISAFEHNRSTSGKVLYWYIMNTDVLNMIKGV